MADRAAGLGRLASGRYSPESQLAYEREQRRKAAMLANMPNPSGQSFENIAPTRLGLIQDWVRSQLGGLGVSPIRANQLGKTAASAGELAGLGAFDEAQYGRPGEAFEAAVGGPVMGLGKRAAKKLASEAAKGLAAPKALKGFGKDGLTYRSPLSSVVMKTPIERMTAEYAPSGRMLPEKKLSWEELEGHNIVPLLGDPTIAGQRLLGLGGKRFEQGVELPGGPKFPRTEAQIQEGAGWANTAGAATTMGNTVAGLGGPSTGVFMKMAAPSVDYAVHMSQVVNQQYKQARAAISDDAVKGFDEAMRSDWIKKKKGGFEYPASKDWPGMDKVTDEWIVSHPVDRKKMIKMMDTRKWQDEGFPEIGYARWATTDPELRDLPSYTSGHSAIRFDPEGRVIRDPKVPHPTYPSQPVGEYSGRLPEVPIEVLHKEYLETGASGKPISNSYLYKFLSTKPPIIRLTGERLERVMKYLESQKGAALGLGGVVAAGLMNQQEADEIRQEL